MCVKDDIVPQDQISDEIVHSDPLCGEPLLHVWTKHRGNKYRFNVPPYLCDLKKEPKAEPYVEAAWCPLLWELGQHRPDGEMQGEKETLFNEGKVSLTLSVVFLRCKLRRWGGWSSTRRAGVA